MISAETGFCPSPSDKVTPPEGRCHFPHNLQCFLPVITKLPKIENFEKAAIFNRIVGEVNFFSGWESLIRIMDQKFLEIPTEKN